MATARLIADGGSAAAEPSQFFRSPEFYAAEGVTHSLAIGDGDGPVLAVVVREIDDAVGSDAISPYGFPGAARADGAALVDADVDWSETGLVSLFVRDRIGEPSLAGGTLRSETRIADPRRPSGLRKRLGQQIRQNERRGWRVGVEPGADAAPEDRDAFERVYGETMARTGAEPRYLFDSSYFDLVLSAEPAWLLLAGREGEAPAAGAIAVRSDGYLHYFLGGTAEEALADSPMKNLFAAMTSLAGELGIALNLGGGVVPGDSLDRFKAGFANATAPFHTHEVVCDPEAYERLRVAASAEPDGFFPAYRAG
jgi:hypothetical protein